MLLFIIIYTIQVGQLLTSPHKPNQFLQVLFKIDLGTNCGIPIKKWLYGFCLIYSIKSIYQFWFESSRKRAVFRVAILDGFLVGWLLYGNVIFYSENNTCMENKTTQYLYILMLCLIIPSSLPVFMYFLNMLTTFLPFDKDDYLAFNMKYTTILKLLGHCSRITYLNF